MDFARNERGFCVGFAWNLILFSFVREREGYKHHADCTVHTIHDLEQNKKNHFQLMFYVGSKGAYFSLTCFPAV